MTSDRPPLELKGLEDRLVSRFASGLSVGLTAPEYETSFKILKNKIKEQNMPDDIIEDDVLKYIAERFSNDVRQLEGAVTRLFAYAAMMNGSEITLDELGLDNEAKIFINNEELNNTYKFTEVGEFRLKAKIKEPYGQKQYIEFSGDGTGYISVSGFISFSENDLRFNASIDQTYIRSFAKELSSKYGNIKCPK